LHRTALITTIQSALHSRAVPNGIVELPEKKSFFPDCLSHGATPTQLAIAPALRKRAGSPSSAIRHAAANSPTPSICREQFARLMIVELEFDITCELLQSATQQIESLAEVLDPNRYGSE
jgi:hypothetical protein